MRTPYIAGNWKLNLGPADAAKLAKQLVPLIAERGRVDVGLFPTALAMTSVVEATKGSGILVGPQEIHAKTSGAFTGTNSASMARAAGGTAVLVGHSERRLYFGETSKGCAAKLRLAIDEGLLPIYCVGETLGERQAGNAETVVAAQITEGLAELEADQLGSLTIAYEPVWAIGTGETATAPQAQAMHAHIRDLLAKFTSSANEIRIQYGGSVKPANAHELLSCPDIDGALVGGASLKAESFAAIIQAAAEVVRQGS